MHLVLIPTYNERENIVRLIDAILVHADVHVLVIDDASPDGTADAVRGHGAFGDRVYLHARPGKLGLGSAYSEGFSWGLDSAYVTFTQMDADFSHHPEDLPRLFTETLQEADVVIGSRKITGGRIEGWNAWRMFCSTGAMLASRLVLGLRTKDVTAGFRTWTRDALQKMPFTEIKSNGYAFQEEALLHAEMLGLRIVEVPVVFRDRVIGMSKLGTADIGDFFLTLMRLAIVRRRRFLHYVLVGLLGVGVDIGVFALLFYGGDLPLFLASCLSTSFAIVHNFLWHHYVVFRAHGRAPGQALGLFVAVSLLGMFMNSGIVVGMVALGAYPLLAKGIAILFVTVWNYALNSRVTFRESA